MMHPASFEEQNKTFNMVVEIPRWTNAKMEMNKAEELNPLSQDKDSAGQVRLGFTICSTRVRFFDSSQI